MHKYKWKFRIVSHACISIFNEIQPTVSAYETTCSNEVMTEGLHKISCDLMPVLTNLKQCFDEFSTAFNWNYTLERNAESFLEHCKLFRSSKESIACHNPCACSFVGTRPKKRLEQLPLILTIV